MVNFLYTNKILKIKNLFEFYFLLIYDRYLLSLILYSPY